MKNIFVSNKLTVDMEKTAKNILLAFPLLIAAVICLDILDTQFRTPSADEEGSWKSMSPDGRFSVTGYSTKSLLATLTPTMPGDGSFGPGLVILWENKTGKLLQQARVENLGSISVDWLVGDSQAIWRKNLATQVGLNGLWEGDYVHVKFVGIWPLPSVDGKFPPPWP